MPITFPLSAAAFQDKLPIAEARFALRRFEEGSGLGSGQPLARRVAPPAFEVSAVLAPVARADAPEIDALFEAIGSMGRVLLSDPARTGPKLDPLGTALGAAAPFISAIDGADRRVIRVGGLPAAYALSAGDMLSVAWSGRRALLRCAEAATAAGTGQTPWFQVEPALPPGVATAAPVDLTNPQGVFVVTSWDAGVTGAAVRTGMSFTALEVQA
jgi:hypothetical protein